MISLIAAIDKNNGIGYKGNLLAYIPGDLPRFKALTTNNTVIMGRKTFESLPKGALPNRLNIVITRNSEFSAPNIITASSLESGIDKAPRDREVFIIGGGEIYKSAMDICDRLLITKINKTFEADTFFPEITEDWIILDEEHHTSKDFDYYYITYRK
jgi:dihydrofolate reductase